MMAANVLDKSQLPDFDEETGLLHKVGQTSVVMDQIRSLRFVVLFSSTKVSSQTSTKKQDSLTRLVKLVSLKLRLRKVCWYLHIRSHEERKKIVHKTAG